MITNLKPYTAYKDSGVEWLGKVPEHWEVRRLKNICRFVYGDALPDASRKDGSVPVYGSNGHVGFHSVPNAQAPCIVIGRKGSFGKVQYSDVPIFAIDTTFFVDGRFTSAHLRWLFFALGWLHLDEVSKDSAVPGLDREDAYKRFLVVPPLSEQIAIVRFLDYMDRRIRRSIRAKQKLIKLLEEYKQALIHQAVTGQIDVRTGKPYPAYKDSGVEWLGKVPEHWEVIPLKRLAWFKSGAGFPIVHQGETSAELPFFKVSDMNIPGNEKYLQAYANTVSLSTARSLGATVFPEGAIIFPKVGGALLTNKRRITLKPCCIDNNVMACVPTNGNHNFLFLIMSWIDLGQIAKPGPVPAISEGEVREIRVAIPPLPEQTAIVEYLDTQTAKLDAAISAARREIELLREYRERLIADVVTGKLDVREAAAQLPEEPPEEEAAEDEGIEEVQTAVEDEQRETHDERSDDYEP